MVTKNPIAKENCTKCGNRIYHKQYQLCRNCYTKGRLDGSIELITKRRTYTMIKCATEGCNELITKKSKTTVCKKCWRKKRTISEKEREYALKSHLKTKYNLTLEQYKQMCEAQGYRCALCGAKEDQVDYRTGEIKRLSVDHDHTTGKIRGLLCGHCNLGIGFLRHNPELLIKAFEYLKEYI